MPLEVENLEASIDIAATPAQVWALVGDPRNMKRWSPQLVRTFLRGGSPAKGSKMFNINRQGALVWPTNAMITTYDPEREIAWRVKDNYTTWGLKLEATDGGTRLSQYRNAPDGISDISARLTKSVLGGIDTFTARLKREMGVTLQRIKADIEA